MYIKIGYGNVTYIFWLILHLCYFWKDFSFIISVKGRFPKVEVRIRYLTPFCYIILDLKCYNVFHVTKNSFNTCYFFSFHFISQMFEESSQLIWKAILNYWNIFLTNLKLNYTVESFFFLESLLLFVLGDGKGRNSTKFWI